MSRRLGSKNKRLSYGGSDRMIKSAHKTIEQLNKFIELSLRNGEAKRNIDYNKLNDVITEIKHLTKKENY